MIAKEQVEAMIAKAIQDAKQEIYRELVDSFESAGDLDHYNYQSIESICSAHTARELGDRIKWMVES